MKMERQGPDAWIEMDVDLETSALDSSVGPTEYSSNRKNVP